MFFICILVFYCGWNLLANTFGQFQTYMLVKANASQSFATGSGLILTMVCLVIAMIFLKLLVGIAEMLLSSGVLSSWLPLY